MTLREGVRWSLPAIALTATIAWSLRRVPGLVESLEVTPQERTWVLLAGSSAAALVGLTKPAQSSFERSRSLFAAIRVHALFNGYGAWTVLQR